MRQLSVITNFMIVGVLLLFGLMLAPMEAWGTKRSFSSTQGEQFGYIPQEEGEGETGSHTYFKKMRTEPKAQKEQPSFNHPEGVKKEEKEEQEQGSTILTLKEILEQLEREVGKDTWNELLVMDPKKFREIIISLPSARANILTLPPELLLHILSLADLSPKELVNITTVSRDFNKLAKAKWMEEGLYREVTLGKLGELLNEISCIVPHLIGHREKVRSIKLVSKGEDVVTDDALELLSNFPNLEKVDLSKNESITGTGLSCLPSTITQLNLSRCMSITDDALKSLEQFVKLERLDLSWGRNVRGDSFDVLPSSLTYLSLRERFCISSENVKKIAQRCPSLRELDLWACDGVTDDSILEIAQGCPHLIELDLGRCSITDKGIGEIARHCNDLRKLNIFECDDITDEGIEALARYCKKLTHLRMGECYKITTGAFIKLIESCKDFIVSKQDIGGCVKVDFDMVAAALRERGARNK